MNCCGRFRSRRPVSVNRKKVTIVVLGLDGSGKSTVISRLKFDLLKPRKRHVRDAVNIIEHPVPTIGFSINLIKQRDCDVSIYELGGMSNFRPVWHEYYPAAHGFIYVVDATDSDKLAESKLVLHDTLEHLQVSGKPVLLLVNKQDVDGAFDEIDIVERLDLETLVNRQKCPTLVELCSARGNLQKPDLGISHGFKWLLRTIVKDYPMLNNRVLVDLAAQDYQHLAAIEENRRQLDIRKNDKEGSAKAVPNGIVKTRPGTPIVPNSFSLPNHLLGNEFTHSQEFFETTWSSTADLIQNISERPQNFLNRPKSAEPRLFTGQKSKKKKIFKPIKTNRTVPIATEQVEIVKLPPIFDHPTETEIVPFQTSAANVFYVEPRNSLIESQTPSENSILTVVEIEHVPANIQQSSPVPVDVLPTKLNVN